MLDEICQIFLKCVVLSKYNSYDELISRYVPFFPLDNMISSPFSRLQTIWGLGCPLALQDRVIFSPSLTTRLGLSSLEIILGGTEKKKGFSKLPYTSISFSDVQKTFGLFLTTYQQLQNILNDASLDLY